MRKIVKNFYRYGCFLLSLILLFTVLPVSVRAEEKDLETNQSKSKVVRVGWYEDSYHITDKNGNRSGYGYEYEQAVSAYTGWNYEYVQGSWEELFQKLQNGEIDMMSALSYTDERAKTMLFSDQPMGEEKYYLYADLANSDISASDLSTLNGKSIGVMENSVQTTQFSEWEKKYNVKTMFVIISDTDDTFNFVVAIMYTQLFNLLCDKADDEHGGRLPYHVRLLLDEFSNIGQIPKFDKLIATIRSREISASIILQSQSQLKTIYKDAAETITGNCDTVLFLGGKESSTLKEISETLGKETIDLYNTSDTRGSNRSYGLNYQKTGKELMSRDELAVMDGDKCILQLRGVRPFLSNKYDITKHKRYKELADYDKKNAFDVEKYLEHRLVLPKDAEFELYECNVTEEEIKAMESLTENYD